jgi:hypothetical protein
MNQTHLQKLFKVSLIPKMVLMEGPTGKVLSENVRLELFASSPSKVLTDWIVKRSSLVCFHMLGS